MSNKSKERDIGFADAPSRTCNDPDCPFHGNLSVRGKVLTGRVISAKNTRTVTIRRDLLARDPKYKRMFKKYSSQLAHCPPCLDVEEGNLVRVGECRPISKTIAFVVIEKLEEKS